MENSWRDLPSSRYGRLTSYTFGAFTLDLERFRLERAGQAVHVERQVFDVLAYLIAHRDRVVAKTELLDNVWGDRFVSESALSSRIKAARRAVDDDGARQQVIRTVFGRGYQFVADVSGEPAPIPPAAPLGGRSSRRSSSATHPTERASPTASSGPARRSSRRRTG